MFDAEKFGERLKAARDRALQQANIAKKNNYPKKYDSWTATMRTLDMVQRALEGCSNQKED